MSNYLSSEYKITNPPQLGDVQLARSVMSTLQGQYNQNKALIDQTLQQYENLRGLRADENEYIANKLKQVKTQIDQYSRKNPNLAYNSNRDSILTAIKSVTADPIVQNAIISKQNFDKYNAEYSKLLEEGKGLANEDNYKYGLYAAGYYDYMQGKTNKLGAIQYTPYTDYNKKVTDVIMDFEKLKDDEIIQVPDGQGGITEVTKKGLTPDQIKRIAMYSLDANDNRQIAIDAWANSNMYTDENAIRNATSFINSKSSQLDIRKSDLETKIKQGGSSNQLAEWNIELDEIKNQQVNLKKMIDSPQALLTYSQQENFLNSVTNRFSSLYTENTKYVADELWWKKTNYDLELAKFKYQQEKDLQKSLQQETEGIQTVTTATVTEDNVANYEQQIDNKISSLKSVIDTDLSAYKDSIEQLAEQDKDAQAIMDKYNTALQSKQAGETDLDVFRRVILDGTINENNNLAIIGNKNYFSNIKNNTLKYDLYLQGMKEATDRGQIEHVKATLDNQDTFKAFYNNPNTKMLWNGRAISVATVLRQNGLMDDRGNKIGDLTAPKNQRILDELKKSYYADDFLSSSTVSPVNDTVILNMDRNKINKLALLFNESGNDALEPFTYQTVNRGYVQESRGYRINPNTKTGQYLLNANSQGIKDTFAWSDQSLSNDDADIAKFVKSDYRNTQTYRNSLEKYLNKLPENKEIIIPTTNKATYENLLSYATSAARSQDQVFNIDKSQGLNIRDISSDYVEVTQNKVTSDGAEPQSVRILKRDFYRTFPNIAQQVDFEANQEVYSFDNLKDKRIVSSNVNFVKQDNVKILEYATEVLLDSPSKQALVPFLKNDDAKRTLTIRNKSLVNKVPNVQSLIDKAVDESANYALNIEVTEGFKSPKLHLKLVEATTGNVIHTVTQSREMLQGISLDSYLEIFNTTPQVLYGTMIDDILRIQGNAILEGRNSESFANLVKSLEK